VYLLRHGATEINLANPPRLQGRKQDLPLAAEGRKQAAQAARSLETAQIAAVFTSPLLRARETAAVIAARHGLQPQVVESLIECDVGDWEDKSWDEIARTDNEAYRRFTADPATNPYKAGESFAQVLARVLPPIKQAAAEHLGCSIAIVAHNIVNRVLLAPVLGVPLAKARGLIQHHCGLNILRFRGGRLEVLTVNAVFHLDSW